MGGSKEENNFYLSSMIMTAISDGTKNVLSKEAKAAIFTSTHLTLQEAMTERRNIAQSL